MLEGQHADLRTLSRMTGVKDPEARRAGSRRRSSRLARSGKGIDSRYIDTLPASTQAALQASRLAAVFRGADRLRPTPGSRSSTSRSSSSQTTPRPRSPRRWRSSRAERERGPRRSAPWPPGSAPKDNRASKGSAQHIGGLPALWRRPAARRRAREAIRHISSGSSCSAIDWPEVVARAEQEWDLTPPPAPVAERAADDADDDGPLHTDAEAVLGRRGSSGRPHVTRNTRRRALQAPSQVDPDREQALAATSTSPSSQTSHVDQIRDVEGNQVRLSQSPGPEGHGRALRPADEGRRDLPSDRRQRSLRDRRWQHEVDSRETQPQGDRPRVRTREPVGPRRTLALGRAQSVPTDWR